MRGAFINTVIAEFTKQHKSNYHSYVIYFSMLLWPVLNLITACYNYKPFQNTVMGESIAQWVSKENIFIFIILGYLSLMFFNSLVQSAWFFSKERISGTLELIYLSPASRMGVITGNALASLFESVWLFSIFCLGTLFFKGNYVIANPFMIIIALLVLIISSVCWGMLLNSIFLLSRDTRTLSTLLSDPMELFSGTRIPFTALPLWGKIFGAIFPLTWSLNLVRKIFMQGANLSTIKFDLALIAIICIVLVTISKVLLVSGERYAKKTGNMAMF